MTDYSLLYLKFQPYHGFDPNEKHDYVFMPIPPDSDEDDEYDYEDKDADRMQIRRGWE